MSKSLSFNEIIEKVEKSKFFNSMIPVIKTGNRRIAVKQISGAMKPALVSALHHKLNRTIFMILGTKEEIEAKTEELAKVSQKLGEAIYADMQAKAQAEQGAADEQSGGPQAADVVDADFKEVKKD